MPFTIQYQVLGQDGNPVGVKGSKVGTGTFKFDFDVPTDSLLEGDYTLKLSIKDDQGSTPPKKTIPFSVDTTPPEMALNRPDYTTLTVGDTYDEKGATATDENGDPLSVNTSGSVDTDQVGTYQIYYTAT